MKTRECYRHHTQCEGPACAKEIPLSTGRTALEIPRDVLINDVVMQDGAPMTEDEWQEYVSILLNSR